VVDRRSQAYVRWVQDALNKLNNAGLRVDGIIGPYTQRAIRDFQASRGLTADGIVGPNTERALIAAGAGSPPGLVSPPYVPPSAPSQPSPGGTTYAQLARQIINSGRVSFLTYHTSECGKGDGADANSNINDAANGRAVRRSSYDCSSSYPAAPGGSVHLNDRMLNGMLNLGQSYTFRVTEIAGGQHSGNSRHYAGVAFDVDLINGQRVTSSNGYYRAFMQRCRDLGATEVLGPGDSGHDTHVHCAWPRP
jgi:hypothetical protein